MALVKGTNCGFVETAPTEDPAASIDYCDRFAIAYKDVAPAGAVKITEIGWWCNNETEEANTEVGIYSHDAANDRPGDLLGSAEFAKGTGIGWKKAAVNIDITPGTTYWVAFQLDDTATTTQSDNNRTAPASKSWYIQALTALPDPYKINGGGGPFNADYAIYAVYTTAAETNMKINIGDTFKDVDSLKLNIGDTWKDVTKVQQNIGGAWKDVFG